LLLFGTWTLGLTLTCFWVVWHARVRLYPLGKSLSWTIKLTSNPWQ
jgi:hypothetical protein